MPLPVIEGNPAIVSSPGLAIGFADNFPEVVCGSPEELGAILSGDYDAWKRYRDQIVGESGGPEDHGRNGNPVIFDPLDDFEIRADSGSFCRRVSRAKNNEPDAPGRAAI